MDREAFLVLTGVGASTGFLSGLVLVAVGFLVVRKHHATGGVLLGAAGATKMLLNLCWVGPTLYAEVGLPLGETVLQLAFAAVLLLRPVAFGLAIGGVAIVANALRRHMGARS